MTSNNTGMQPNIAINYGGRSDILHSVKNISKLIETKKITSDHISEKTIQENLISSCVLNIDLLIRTSEEKIVEFYVMAIMLFRIIFFR